MATALVYGRRERGRGLQEREMGEKRLRCWLWRGSGAGQGVEIDNNKLARLERQQQVRSAG